MNTSTTAKIVGGIVVVLAIVGAYVYPQSTSTTIVRGVSSLGASNSDAKIATITVAPLTAAATTTSILNDGGTDRMISSSIAACTSVGTSNAFVGAAGVATFQLQMATGTQGFGGLRGNTNIAEAINIATSSAWSYQASTTLPATGAMSLVWPVSTYLNMTFNATNTASCTVGVSYVTL